MSDVVVKHDTNVAFSEQNKSRCKVKDAETPTMIYLIA